MSEESNNKSRLMISHMKLVNFKSYAGTKIVGPFHKKFSAVVGPNGSGKSNVIDAMLFVFGRRASKLRLKKVSQLIHNSAFHPDCTKCAVSVYFQEIVDREGDEDGFDIVPDSKFVVTREAFKDNKSHYIIDSKKSNFTDVTTLLKKKGIDLDNNRFLILQGEVEQISLMKPKAQTQYDVGMLEYLEDIIGSNTYVEPIEEAAGKVKQFEDERLLVLQKAVALEKARDELEGSKTEAEEFLEKERSLFRLNAIRAQLHLVKVKDDAKFVEKRIQELDQKRQAEHEKLKDKETEVLSSKEDYERISSEHNRIAEEVEACSKEWATFERKDIKYREDIKHAKAQAKKAASTVKRNQNKAKKCEKTVMELQESIPSLEDKIEAAKMRKKEEEAKLDEIYDSIKEKTEQLRLEMQVKEKELEPLRQNVDDSKAKVKATKTKLDLLVEQAESGRVRVENARKELAEFEERKRQLNVEMEKTRSEEVKIAAEEATVVEQLETCIEKTKKCEDTLRNSRAAVESARLAQKQNASMGDVLKALLKAARPDGALSKIGLHGRLGDLGAIDSKYDVAISTAAGALDHIVVQNTAGAQACIQYLRNNSLGRATFICLDELGYLDKYVNDKVFKTPKGAHRLFDLIDLKDKRFANAFFFAVRNTLVAKDLDSATKIAFSGKDGKARFRVVTLNGQLIDTSGTMSGGGRARKGRMGSAVVDNDAALQHSNAETQFQTAKKELSSLKSTKSKLEKQAKTLKKTRHKLQLKLSKLKMEIASLPEQHTALKAELKQAQEEFGESEDDEETREQIESLQAQLKKQQKNLSEAEKKASKVKKIVDELQSRIMDAGGDKLRKQKDTVKKVTDDLKNATKALSKAHVDIRSNTKNVTKAEAAMADAEKQEAKANKTVEKIRAELQRMDEDAQELLQRREQAQEALKERETALRAIESEFRKVQKIVSDIKLALVDVESQHEDLCKSKKKNENIVKHWTDKVKLLVETYVQMMKEAVATTTSPTKEEEDEKITSEKKKKETKVQFTEEELKSMFELNKIEDEILVLEDSRDKAKNTINMGAIQEYFAKEAEYQTQMKELESVTEKRDEARNKHDSLRKKRLEMFSTGFFKIKMKLKEMYRMLTLGGDAELEQVDTLDPFSEGILFSVRPPRKSWKSISNLSGGEKTLCSLALVFALHHFRPTPLYVMDEIDAALDFKNVSIIANYIKDRADGAQFVVISLRNNMFELADRLVGIYKTNDATKSVTINPKAMALSTAKKKGKVVSNALSDRTNNVSVPPLT